MCPSNAATKNDSCCVREAELPFLKIHGVIKCVHLIFIYILHILDTKETGILFA